MSQSISLKSKLVLPNPQLTLGNSDNHEWQRLNVYREFCDMELCGQVWKGTLLTVEQQTLGIKEFQSQTVFICSKFYNP